MNLIQRIQKITEEIQSIDKTGYNDYSKYKYVEAVAVIEEVRKLMIKHGVVCIVQEDEIKREQYGKNFHTTLRLLATYYNIDDPMDKLIIPFYSVAADTLDKDIYKAKTNGLKYLFLHTFKIPVDMPDVENSGKLEKETAKYEEEKQFFGKEYFKVRDRIKKIENIESYDRAVDFLNKKYSEFDDNPEKDTLWEMLRIKRRSIEDGN